MKTGEEWQICHLGERDKIESFRCGDPDLDDFLLNDSKLFEKQRLAVTYVLKINDSVMAYFSLAILQLMLIIQLCHSTKATAFYHYRNLTRILQQV